MRTRPERVDVPPAAKTILTGGVPGAGSIRVRGRGHARQPRETEARDHRRSAPDPHRPAAPRAGTGNRARHFPSGLPFRARGRPAAILLRGWRPSQGALLRVLRTAVLYELPPEAPLDAEVPLRDVLIPR